MAPHPGWGCGPRPETAGLGRADAPTTLEAMPELAGKLATPSRLRPRARGIVALAARGAVVRDSRPGPEEEPCGVRTPFQRDRDRIVHSKPFRRLKGKTQVFIDPQGDHYRTRMTHTLETAAISRVVARALRLNEDLTEAIGSGTTSGTRRSATPARRRSTTRFGTGSARFGFRHYEQSHRIARALNLTHEVCDGILTHTGHRHPGDPRGRRSFGWSTALRTSTTTSTTRSVTASFTTTTCRAKRSSSRPDRPPKDRHARPRPRRDLRAPPVTSASPKRSARRCFLRVFMFDRVYLADHAREEHPGARGVTRSSTTSPSAATPPARSSSTSRG